MLLYHTAGGGDGQAAQPLSEMGIAPNADCFQSFMCNHPSPFFYFSLPAASLFLTHMEQYTSHIASSCNTVYFQFLCSQRNEGAVNRRLVIKNQRTENESFPFFETSLFQISVV